jgi:hypothetical protein
MATVAPGISKPMCLADSRADRDAASRGFVPAERSPFQRLPGDDRRRRVPVHAVGVHHPGHDLLVRVHVGCGHVFLGADRVDDFRDVAARELSSRRDMRVGSQMTPPTAAEWDM